MATANEIDEAMGDSADLQRLAGGRGDAVRDQRRVMNCDLIAYGPPAADTEQRRAFAWAQMLAAAGMHGEPEPYRLRPGTNYSGGPGWMDNTGFFGKPSGRKA